ncbi:MAG: glycosyltransferase family 39 protein, partial [Betaproteobacteria bacterium]|nr:glycosyltransferase family 39 protein [Betaproteobacteria bacterium]
MAVPASRAVRTEGTTRWLSLAWPIVVAVLLIGITGVRLVDLELDPPFTKRIGDVSDEGYWAHNARLKALTGAFVQDPFNQALTTAPLYTAINALVFSLLGVSLGTARLVSAVAGVFTLLAGAGVIARTTGNRRWAAAFVAVLGVNDLFFAYNRIGLVEPTLNLFVFMAFLAFYQGLGSSRLWWFAASGACFGFAVLTKATGVYVLLAFLLAFAMELIVWRTVSARAFAAWVAGMGLPGVAGLTVAWLGF